MFLRIALHRFVGLVVAICAAVSFAGQPPAPPEGWTDSFVVANGIRMHYWRTGGEKPVLLMLHGSSDDGLCWTSLAKEVADEYDIVLPMHGATACRTRAERTIRLMSKLKISRP